jgi:CubicO group peptidase (beta-lactamase class C family)
VTLLVDRVGIEAALEPIAAELERVHIPGLELAVVAAGEVLHAGGLGQRGISDPAPVTATTRFHHGSCGKAYTGLLAALLADAGEIDLDAPVRRYVPELRLPDPVIADRVTLRDLLGHRSGLARHDLLWILDPSLDRQELVRRLEFLPVGGDLRNQWLYSNLGFTLAGYAMQRAAGSTYEQLLVERLLEPLGMSRSTQSLSHVLADPDHAHPHVVRGGVAVETQWRQDAAIAPAGGVVSCADDAVRWLGAQLGDAGALSAAALVSQQPVTPLPSGLSPFPELGFHGYGLGWSVGSYRGRPLVWHNGGVDGFGTQTLLLPGQRIGILTCANVMDTTTTLGIVLMLADLLLGESSEPDWLARMCVAGDGDEAVPEPRPATPAAPPTRPLAAFCGTYRHRGYGDVVVSGAAGGLAVRVLGSDVAAEHRHFETWDLRYEPLDLGFTLTFAAGPDGSITEAVIPLDPALPPVRFERVAAAAG